MKRWISLMLMAVLLLGTLTACGGQDSGTSGGNDTPDASADGETSDLYPKHTLAASIPLTGNLMQYGISYQIGRAHV